MDNSSGTSPHLINGISGGVRGYSYGIVLISHANPRLCVNTVLGSYLEILVKLHLSMPQCVDNPHVVCTVDD